MAFNIITACFTTSKLHFLFLSTPEARGRSQSTAVWVYSWASLPEDSNLWGGCSRPLPWGACRYDYSDSNDYRKFPEAGALLSSVASAQENVESTTLLQPFLPGTRQCPVVLVGLAGQGTAAGRVQHHACAQEVDCQIFSEFTYVQNHKHSYWIWSRNTKYVCCLQTWRV